MRIALHDCVVVESLYPVEAEWPPPVGMAVDIGIVESEGRWLADTAVDGQRGRRNISVKR